MNLILQVRNFGEHGERVNEQVYLITWNECLAATLFRLVSSFSFKAVWLFVGYPLHARYSSKGAETRSHSSSLTLCPLYPTVKPQWIIAVLAQGDQSTSPNQKLIWQSGRAKSRLYNDRSTLTKRMNNVDWKRRLLLHVKLV
jgi:hypothetical protein